MRPAYSDEWATVYVGDAAEALRALPAESVHAAICSPPYWGLRSYLPAGHPDKAREIGAERTPEDYVERLVGMFREVRRVLRSDGTLWLNIGDAYANVNRSSERRRKDASGVARAVQPRRCERCGEEFEGAIGRRFCSASCGGSDNSFRGDRPGGLKAKDLIGIPWMLAFALRADGWYLRSEIIWAKDAVMPESVTDRPTRSHEHLFLLSKSPRYFYDAWAVREPSVSAAQEAHQRRYAKEYGAQVESSECRQPGNVNSKGIHARPGPGGRNLRDVWRINPRPFAGSHYATFPPELVYPCVKAGTSEHGVCAECGTPWRRILETGRIWTAKDRGTTNKVPHHTPQGTARSGNARAGDTWSRTVGWEPACPCESPDEPIPATVLDPFVGSGTALYAARKLGRKSVGIDLDERNLEHVEGRLGLQGVLL